MIFCIKIFSRSYLARKPTTQSFPIKPNGVLIKPNLPSWGVSVESKVGSMKTTQNNLE